MVRRINADVSYLLAMKGLNMEVNIYTDGSLYWYKQDDCKKFNFSKLVQGFQIEALSITFYDRYDCWYWWIIPMSKYHVELNVQNYNVILEKQYM